MSHLCVEISVNVSGKGQNLHLPSHQTQFRLISINQLSHYGSEHV